MVQSIRFRGDDDDVAKLRKDAKSAGFRANVSAYIRHKLGLPPARMGRPPKSTALPPPPPAKPAKGRRG